MLLALCLTTGASVESGHLGTKTLYVTNAVAVGAASIMSGYEVSNVYSVAPRSDPAAAVLHESSLLTRVSLTPSGIFVHPSYCPPSDAGSTIWRFEPDGPRFVPAGTLYDLVAAVVYDSRDARVMSLQLPVQPDDVGVICISHVKQGTKAARMEAVLLRIDDQGTIEVSTSVLLSTERAYKLYLTPDRLVAVEFSSPAGVYRTRLLIYESDGQTIHLSSQKLIGGCDLPELDEEHDYTVSTDCEFVYVLDQIDQTYRILSLEDGTLADDGIWQDLGLGGDYSRDLRL